jgi:hypothetical protein
MLKLYKRSSCSPGSDYKNPTGAVEVLRMLLGTREAAQGTQKPKFPQLYIKHLLPLCFDYFQ